MRKVYNCFLFFTFVLVFSSFATDRGQTSVEIIRVKVSQMSEVIGILEKNNVTLKETAFFSDFDETLATTVGTYQGHEFQFLSCPDRIRTYKEVFAAAFQKSQHNLYAFDFMNLSDSRYSETPVSERYEVLDKGVTNLIGRLCEDAGFVGVCSALPGNDEKNNFMEYVGLDKENYIYAENGKPQAIYKCLESITQTNKNITTIVLIDNSGEFAITPFLEKMPILVKGLGLPHLKIIGIEFTKFAEMATQEAIEKELTLLQTLCNK